jgi:hypothetical protein
MSVARRLILPTILCCLLFAFNIPTSAQAPYCAPVYSTGCTFGDGLILFQLNTISQPIPCDAYYHDYTAVSTQLQPGTTYTLTVQAGYSSSIVTVWVDLDNDGAFNDANERLVYNLNCSSAATNYTVSFTIPPGTSAGNHRLRYRTEWLSPPSNACSVQAYGNSADFTIVVPSTSTVPSLTTWGVLLTMMLIVTAGCMRLRRA